MTTIPAKAAPEKIALSYRDVSAVIGLGRRTIVRMVATGKFPAPRLVGSRRLFDRAEVQAWFDRQPRSAG